MMEPILLIRINIFLGFARRIAPDSDYNSGSACRKGQVGPVTKMQKIMKKLIFLISIKVDIYSYSRGRGSSRNSKMMI